MALIFRQIAPVVSSSSSSYNNLINWPSDGVAPRDPVQNRPVTSNNVISWIGPLVPNGSPGGYHASTATDVRQSRTLGAVQTTTLATSSNGQVIEGVNISVSGTGVSAIQVGHNNVTIRQSRIKSSAADSNDYTRTIVFLSGVTGTVIEDCEIIGGASDHTTNGTYLHAGFSAGQNINEPFGGTFARLKMTDGIKGFGQCVANATIIDCLICTMSGDDTDYIAPWGNSHDVDIEHCYLDQHDERLGGGDSVLNMSNFGGAAPQNITNITFNNNAITRGPDATNPHSVFADKSFSTGVISNVTITNNGFYNHAVGEYGSCASAVTSGYVDHGNYVMASSTATSGAALNGTGQLG